MDFYEFLGKIEDNYGWTFDKIQVKTEKVTAEAFDNFVDISEINESYHNTEQPVLISQNLSEKLRTPGTSVKVEKIKEESIDELIEPITKLEEHDDDSDFEWPQNDEETTSWSLPTTSGAAPEKEDEEEPKRPLRRQRSARKIIDDEDEDYEP